MKVNETLKTFANTISINSGDYLLIEFHYPNNFENFYDNMFLNMKNIIEIKIKNFQDVQVQNRCSLNVIH